MLFYYRYVFSLKRKGACPRTDSHQKRNQDILMKKRNSFFITGYIFSTAFGGILTAGALNAPAEINQIKRMKRMRSFVAFLF